MAEDINKQPIDLQAITKKLWLHRKTFFKVLPVVLITTYLITLLVPRTYKCDVILAPESSGPTSGSSISSIASSFGLGSLAKMAGNNDAINAEIYPDLFKSNDFVVKLMGVDVSTKDGNIKCDYYTYLKDKQKSTPWDKVRGFISELINPTPKDKTSLKDNISIFNLTKRQSELLDGVKGKLKCVVDKKTDVVTITVSDQDPLVAATIANATCQKLQQFIVDYRTSKARVDYEYYLKLCSKAKDEYETVRKAYGAYSDANEDLVLASYRLKADDMENDMQLKYNMYSTLNTQLQMAQAKLQESTPAFTVIQSASVPVKPAGPKRTLIALVMTFLAAVVISCYIIAKK